MTYKDYINEVKDKNIGFLGIGRSNMPLIKMLAQAGVKVSVRDKRERGSFGAMETELMELGVTIIAGGDYLLGLEEHDIIYKTPVIRSDLPEIKKAVAKGSVLSSEMELFFNLCPAKIFGITGSDGKTTTTTLIYEMLKKEGHTCHLGGNIGRPLIGDIENIKESDFAIVELSSFQLFDMKKSPDVAVITNLSENHLDWHVDYDEYKEAKKNIFKFQGENSLLVLNEDNLDTNAMKGMEKGELRTFSLCENADAYLKDGVIYLDGEALMEASLIRIPGIHNVANFMTAILAVKDYVSKETIKYVAKNFEGVAHRIEFIKEINGVSYYNDSIASSPARTKASLNAFAEKVILIAGGRDKNLSYDELGEVISKKAKAVVLVGETKDKIKASIEKVTSMPIYVMEDFKEAVLKASEIAVSGDKVVLSPASTSFDMFRDFEERGNRFRDIVNNDIK